MKSEEAQKHLSRDEQSENESLSFGFLIPFVISYAIAI